jgi:hypothetical protein
MKKIFMMLMAATLAAPAIADESKVKSWNSFDSMGCMMLRECTKDVRQVKTWRSLGDEYEAFEEEISDILKSLSEIGVNVYIGDDKYFAFNTRGLYSVKGNDMFLNERYLSNPTMMVKVLRHEGWHIAQDCMAGTIDNTFTGVILQDGVVPDWIANGAEKTYPQRAVPYEAEAMYAAFSDSMTRDALKVCAGPKKMWEVYKPTPLTKKWLLEQGFIAK